MKFRVLSDLHLDYNSYMGTRLRPFRRFAVFAGDVSGDPGITIREVRRLAKGGGVLVAGNHIVYNDRGMDIWALRRELAEAFPPGGDVVYLDPLLGTCSVERDGVLFVGGTMYTDYALVTRPNPNGVPGAGMESARPRMSGGMNDFRWGKVADPAFPEPRWLRPEDYLEWHRKSVEEFDRVLDVNEGPDGRNLPVVMVTHHAPFPEALALVRRGDVPCGIDSSYASDMSAFAERHPSIRAWAYGHVHDPVAFVHLRKDGTGILCVDNAHGYWDHFQTGEFRPALAVDTDNWKVVPGRKASEYKFRPRRGKKKRKGGNNRDGRTLTDLEAAALACLF